MFTNQTISKRLKTAFFWISLLVAISGTIGVIAIQIVGYRADVIFEEKYPIAREAYQLATSANSEMLALHSHLLGEEGALRLMGEWNKKSSRHLLSLTSLIFETEDQQRLIKIRTSHEEMKRLSAELAAFAETESDHKLMMKLLEDQEARIDEMLAYINQLVEHAEADMTLAMERADASQEQGLYALVILTLLAFIVAFWLGQHISNSITHPLNALVACSKSVADGNLTQEISGKEALDEIGELARAFHSMTDSLRKQVQEILDGTSIIATSVTELSSSSAELASSSAENAASINETTTTIEEVRQTSELASTKAEQMAEESRQIRETSQRGKAATDDTLDGMLKVQTQMTAIAETIIRLSEQGQSIGQIIATVDSLSEQSNVLAVNASIEAAKAGEHGKGFSVVAQEVKSLADQSKQATMQVRNILNEIQKATSTAVMATEQGNKAVEKGTETAGQAGQSIEMLANTLDQSANAAIQIAAASQQQRVGMDQITTAMESVSEASRQNAVSAKELEGAVYNLQALGEKLKDIVQNYQI